MRLRALALASISALLLSIGAGQAKASEFGNRTEHASIEGRTLAQKFRAAYWRGRTCITPACKAARPSSIAHVASFGLAAFGGIWISRRRSG